MAVQYNGQGQALSLQLLRIKNMFKHFQITKKNYFRFTAILIFLIALISTVSGCTKSKANNTSKKVLIIGFDGMDPQLLERMMGEDKMPNFRHLKETGSFLPLQTSMPPQSPVAWANFITGLTPGGHGIFDFIHNDPKTMIPYLSTSETKPAGNTIKLGKWIIPLSGGEVLLLRKGKAFWEILEDKGIPTTVFRIPSNFPPVKTEGRALSGMGTPDIVGSYGTFSFYTNRPETEKKDVSGGKIYEANVADNKVEGKLMGPPNAFVKDNPTSTVDFVLYLDPKNPVGKVVVGDREAILKQGEWSRWVRVEFEMIPYIQSVYGICKFFLKEVRPDFKLYVSPVNIDPSAPAMPISTPQDYSEELCEQFGYFYTQGMPEDTKALSGGILNDGEYLQQSDFVLKEREEMFDYELNRFKSGLLFYYFGTTDLNSHMFWRTTDKTHPAYDKENGEKYAKVIENLYIEMDGVLGKAFKKIDSNTTLIVMSDHGFAPYYRSFQINTWLMQNGYIKLNDESAGESKEFFENVDWSGTKAYSLGFNGLYINRTDREANGIVERGPEYEKLLDEISKKLLEARDPKNGEKVVLRVYKASEIYKGPYVKNSPDLLIGYARGYRTGWEAALGAIPKALLKDNTEKWSGDHCMAAEEVPGIILSNKKIKLKNPSLTDLAPTVLSEFGIPKLKEMVGTSIY